MYGIAIRPTRMMLGRTTPAIHGSKYTRSSWRPRKYHGAFDGFGVTFAFAGASSGAFVAIDHIISGMKQIVADKSAARNRYGQTCSFSRRLTSAPSTASTGVFPFAIAASFLAASRKEIQVTSGTEKNRMMIGMLSGF